MNLTVVLFAAVAAVTACSAVGVAASRSVVRAAVWLLFTLIGVAVLYFLLGAEFLGAAQFIVYVGGTMVLMVFGVMITNQGPFAVLRTKPVEYVVGGTLAAGLFALLVVASLGMVKPSPPDEPLPGVNPLGLAFLGVDQDGKSYLLPFEIVSVHLLVVLVAAAYLARAKRRVSQQTLTPGPSPTRLEDSAEERGGRFLLLLSPGPTESGRGWERGRGGEGFPTPEVRP